jgi:hypothetical protein
MKRNIYTFIQVIAAGLLITIKISEFAFLFPFILILLVPFRKWCLPFLFTERELTEVDFENFINENLYLIFLA